MWILNSLDDVSPFTHYPVSDACNQLGASISKESKVRPYPFSTADIECHLKLSVPKHEGAKLVVRDVEPWEGGKSPSRTDKTS